MTLIARGAGESVGAEVSCYLHRYDALCTKIDMRITPNPAFRSIEKFSKHPSIISIKNRMSNSNCTFFKGKFLKLIQNPNVNKTTHTTSVQQESFPGQKKFLGLWVL